MRTVRLHPDLVAAAWRPRLAGGNAAWAALDAALRSPDLNGVDVILPLPVPAGEGTADLWAELIFDTVRRAAGQVSRFEIWAGSEGDERYLQFYESGVWAVYRADRKAVVGGPGVDWRSGGVEALIGRCRDRNLPLHFVSWRVDVTQREDLQRSVRAVQGLLDRYALPARPGLVIGDCRTVPGSGVSPTVLTLSSLLPVLGMDVDAVCQKASGAGEAALRAFGRLGRVRLPMRIDAPDRGVEGIATLDGEAVIALFWQREGDAVPLAVLFSGLVWGKQIRVRRYRMGGKGAGAELAEEAALPMREPLKVEFLLGPGELTMVRVSVEN